MTKPTAIGPDKIDPFGFRCDLYFENDTALKNRAGFDWGVRASAGEVVFTKTRFGFAGEKGTVVQLTEGGGIRKCFKVQADGRLVGYNSDYYGFKHSLEIFISPDLQHKALVLGTGGAAKAVTSNHCVPVPTRCEIEG